MLIFLSGSYRQKNKNLPRLHLFNHIGWVIGCLGFMAYQPLYVIYHQIHFYANSQFYFKQISLAWVDSLIVKNISISSYSV